MNKNSSLPNPKPIKVWMIENDSSPEELAVLLKVSFYTVRNILSGKRVSDSTLELLSAKTGIPFEELTQEAE